MARDKYGNLKSHYEDQSVKDHLEQLEKYPPGRIHEASKTFYHVFKLLLQSLLGDREKVSLFYEKLGGLFHQYILEIDGVEYGFCPVQAKRIDKEQDADGWDMPTDQYKKILEVSKMRPTYLVLFYGQSIANVSEVKVKKREANSNTTDYRRITLAHNLAPTRTHMNTTYFKEVKTKLNKDELASILGLV